MDLKNFDGKKLFDLSEIAQASHSEKSLEDCLDPVKKSHYDLKRQESKG